MGMVILVLVLSTQVLILIVLILYHIFRDPVLDRISQETDLFLDNGGHHCETEPEVHSLRASLRLVTQRLQLNALSIGVSPSIHEALGHQGTLI